MPDTFAYVASFSKEEERRLLKGSGDGKQVTSVTPFSFLSSGTPERPSFTTEAGWELGGIEVTTATDTKAGRSQRESTRLPDGDFPWSHTAHRQRNAPACACAAACNACARAHTRTRTCTRMQPSAARQRRPQPPGALGAEHSPYARKCLQNLLLSKPMHLPQSLPGRLLGTICGFHWHVNFPAQR